MVKHILTIMALSVLGLVSYGQELEFNKRMSAFVTGSYVPVVTGDNEDVTSPGATSNFVDENIRDYITLGIDHHSTVMMEDPYTLEVDVLVTPLVPSVAFTITLEVDYNAYKEQDYRDKDTYFFTNESEFNYEIQEIRKDGLVITSLPDNAYLDGDIRLRRYYDFTQSLGAVAINTPQLLDLDCEVNGTGGTQNDEILLTWTTVPGAVEYQLEWTFINNYSAVVTASGVVPGAPMNPADLAYDFVHNSTRITTEQTNYKIPLLFEQGHFIYRVRAVGEVPGSPGKFVYSSWNVPDQGTVQNVIANFPNNEEIIEAHQEKINWQVTTTFAEEGKKKEVASYYDGSLRNRQSVTKVNTDDNVIVGETIYDHQGRPAVNVLPVPVQDGGNCVPSENDVIKFYPEFNQNSNGESYDREDFDLDGVANCSRDIDPMLETNKGASKYYSGDNVDQDNEQAYVPDADGYPFTVVEYTPDNTGRIRRQSGVGTDFQLGTGHESKYFYGKPDQIQIDRLFGSEVGYAKHYKKNMVVDPNGQISVSYLDQEGRVIATSLAGTPPNNLDEITSYTNALVEVTEKMILPDEDNLTPLGNVNQMELAQTILVSNDGDYEFTYDLSVDNFQDECMLMDICYSCIYDLKISLVDDCGAELFSLEINEGNFSRADGNDFISFEPSEVIADCNLPNYSNTHSFIVPLIVGNYNLVKTLTINEDAAGYYLDHYLATDAEFDYDSYLAAYFDPQTTYDGVNYLHTDCLMSFEDFVDGYIAEIDTMDCYIDCDACAASLGDRDDYILDGGTGEEYDALLAACLNECEEPTMCEMAYEMILADVSPGGQYGEYLDNGGNVNPSFYPVTVFAEVNLLPGGNRNWKNPQVMYNGSITQEYLDANGTPSLILVTPAGAGYSPAVESGVTPQVINGAEYVRPHELANVEDFLDLWEESWAKSLVRHHPEYCYYEMCVGYEEEDANGMSSEKFDAELRAMSFDDALTAGYLLPIGGNGNLNGYTVDLSSDPFVAFTGAGNYNASLVADFQGAIASYATIGGTPYAFYEVASLINKCGTNQIGNSTVDPNCILFGADYYGNAAEDDEMRELSWSSLVAFYLGKKQELINDDMDEQAIAENCFNDCIGEPDFSPFASGFHDGSSGIIGVGNPAYSGLQTCSFLNKFWFEDKQKRFPDVRMDFDFNANDFAYSFYQQTGLCPAAFSFQHVLNEIAAEGLLFSPTFILKDEIDAYTSYIIAAEDGNFSTPIPSDKYLFNSSSTTNLQARIQNTNGNLCVIDLNTVNAVVIDWNEVVGFVNLTDVTEVGGVSAFYITAVVEDANGDISYVELIGQTCLPIATCNFAQTCELTDLGSELEELINALIVDNDLYAASYAIPSTYVTTLGIGDEIEALFGTSLDNLSWEYDGVNETFTLRESATDYLTISLDDIQLQGSSVLGDEEYISNFKSQFENYFSFKGFDATGTLTVKIEGAITYTAGGSTSGLSVGNCGTPTTCDEIEHQNLDALVDLIGDDFFRTPNGIDLTALNLSGNLTFYLDDPNTPTTSSESYVSINDDNFVTLVIENGECDWTFVMESNSSITFADITRVNTIEASGAAYNGNFYEFTINATVEVSGIEEDVVIIATTCIPLQNCEECLGAEDSNPDFSSINPIEPTDAFVSSGLCAKQHIRYEEIQTIFETYANANSIGILIPDFTSTDFSAQDLCNCLEAFEAHIDYIIDNNITSVTTEDLDITGYCSEAPCTQSQLDPSEITTVTIPYSNPCVEDMLNQVFSNAANAYQDYLDNVSQAFLEDYYSHCHDALNESFEKTYNMNEHHYTLYYYDQAGNLVKTVPPEGVELLGLDNASDPTGALAGQIHADRENKTHTVFTSHKLATKYHYNSLNQLVKQSLPDHDQMEILDFDLVTGLDSDLQGVTVVDFVDENNGFMGAWKLETLANGDEADRGYAYKTTDGGYTWTRIKGLVASDINAIQYVNNDLAFAVGDHGLLLKSVDGGSSWDMIDLYAAGVVEDLIDLHIKANGNGLLVGKNGTVVKYQDGTTPTITLNTVNFTFTNPIYNSGFGNDIQSIVFDDVNGEYIIAVTKNYNGDDFGAIYRSNDEINWAAEEKNEVSSLNDVEVVSATTYVATGDNGLLLRTTDAGDNWMVRSTGLSENISDAYFLNDLVGVVIAGNKLYHTNDGGTSFSLLDGTRTYVSLNGFEKQAAQAYAMATADNGEVVRVILSANSVAVDPQEVQDITPSAVGAAWADVVGTDLAAIVVNGTSEMAITSNYLTSTPTWTVVDNGLGLGMKEIRFVQSGTDHFGAFVTTTDVLYHFTIINGTFTATQLGSGDTYSDLTLDKANNEFSGYNSVLGTIETYGLLAGSSVGTVTLSTAGVAGAISQLGNDYVYVGSDGVIKAYTGAVATQSKEVKPLPINSLENFGTETMGASESGDIYRLSGGGEIIPTNTASDLNDVYLTSATEATFVGDNGAYVTYNSGAVTESSLGSENLQGIAYNTVCDCGVIVGDNDTKYAKATGSSSWLALPSFTQENHHEAALNDNGIYSIVGEEANVVFGAGTYASQNERIFGPRIFDVSFNDAAHGVVSGGLNYFARRTTDGGETWHTIAPSSSDLSAYDGRIRMIKEFDDQTFMGGSNGYLVEIDQTTNEIANTITLPSFGTDKEITDIDLGANGVGYLVGGIANQTTSGFLFKTTDYGQTWTSVRTGMRRIGGLHFFEHNETVMFVGDQGRLYYYDGSAFIDKVLNTGYALRDLDFYGETVGYVSAQSNSALNDPVLFRLDAFSWNNASERKFTSLSFDEVDLTDDTGIQTDNSLKHVATVEVISPEQIFVGGNYRISSTERYTYARMLTDLAGEYSTYFYYDKLGRIVVSQNSRQHAETPKKYSYTLYDELGRVVEAGEKEENTNLPFSTIFGTYVSDHYNPNVIDDTRLNDWVNGDGPRREVTHSYYDEVVSTFTLPATFVQNEENLRKRIGAVTYEDVYDGDDATYDYATHYDYDIHGNVKTLLQDNKKLGNNSNPDIQAQQFKRMDYDYDLISGNVHQVSYQAGEADQWMHRYDYDADNRIRSVETSDDGLIWEEDARYFYYDHGPLARVELGENNVQGVDYAYTLQGWLKGVNSDLLNPANDIGKDGWVDASNANQNNARDAFGFSLNYFTGDYAPINPTMGTSVASFNSSISGSDVENYRSDLYNGNIGSMVTTLKKPMEFACMGSPTLPTIHPQATAYKYDQLNRLLEARAFVNIDADDQSGTYNTWLAGTVNPDARYFNRFTYDANGNIESQVRKDAYGNIIDLLTYNYAKDQSGNKVQNRLYSVNDIVDYDDADIDDMDAFVSALDQVNNGSNNYKYDPTGQLIQDKQEQIAEIIWRVDGKIFAIVRDAGSAKSNLVFDYDPMGNRIAKHEYSNDNFPDNGIGSPIYEPDVDRDAANWIKSTYYNRDAQGNVMAIYEYDVDTDNNVSHYTLAERNIYGSSRVGMNIHEVEMISATNITDHVFSFIGKRQYELSNHLGNVLSVISDRKFAFDENTDGTIDYYEPDVLLTYDYSPFGVILTESEDGIANAGSGDIPADLHWTFDGGDLTEQNGTGLDVTVFNGPVAISDRCNVSDNALLFDGVDDYATVPDDPQLEFGQNDFTVAVWVKKISQTTHGNTAVGNWKGGGASPGQNEWILTTAAGSNGTGEAVFSIESGSTIYKVEASSNIGFGNWAHIVGVRRGEYLEIYLDGVLSGSKYVGNITMNNMNRDMLIDGMYGNSQMLLSNSVIDDIRIYNRALSDGEVYGLYALGGCTNSMTAGSGDVPADFRWTFDGGSLTEENGTGLNVTLFNGVSVATGRCNQGDGLYFDGADDYATIPDDPQLDFEGDDFSIAVWAKKVSATTFGNAVVGNWRSGAAQGDNEWNLGIGSGTNGTGPSAFSIESGTTRYSAWSTSGITLGEWVHVVGVRNGDYLEIYMNGVLEGTTFIGNVSVNNLNRDLIIASIYGASTQRYTDVVIDDIRMYNRALSSGEVYTLYVLGGCTGPVAGSVEPQRSFVKTVATETTFLMEDFPIQDDFNDGTTQGWIELSTSAEASNVNNSLAIEKDGGGQAVGVGKQFTTIAGYHYYFSALVDKGSCNAASLIDIRIEDNTGALIYNTTLGSGSQTFTFDFVAPTSSTYTIEFERIGNNSNCTFYVDDVEIREEYESTLCEFKDYDAYRYGHNGMERDDEVSGDGNSYTTEYRAYNPRLARWTSLDPLMAYYPNMSGYVAFANCPVYFSDPTGLAPEGGEDPPVEEVRKQNNVYTSEFTPLLPENPAHGQIITYEFVTSDTDGEVVSMSYSWNEHEKDWAVTKTSENPFNPLADESSYILSWGGAKNPYVNGILIDAITGEANVPIVSKTEPEPSMLEQVSEYGTAIGFTTYVTGDLLNNQLSSSSTGIGKTGRASNTGSSLKTSLRYNMPKTPIRTPIGTVQAPTRLVSGVANTASKIAKAAPLISVGFTAIDIFATQTVKTSHVFNTMYTAGAMIAGGPAGLIMGGGYLLAEGVAWMCGTSVSETIDGIADYFGLSGGIIWDW